MRKLHGKAIIAIIASAMLLNIGSSAFAESLFQTGISYNASPSTPRSLFASIRATNVGDLVTIVISENTSMTNTVTLNDSRQSEHEDKWSGILDRLLPGKGVVSDFDGYGGGSKTTNNSNLTRTSSINHLITTQVVQVLPNGNLVLQGRKQVVNAGENQEFIVTGIVNPRLVDGNGRINSENVANLQLAVTGKGTVSQAQSGGIFNKLVRFLF